VGIDSDGASAKDTFQDLDKACMTGWVMRCIAYRVDWVVEAVMRRKTGVVVEWVKREEETSLIRGRGIRGRCGGVMQRYETGSSG